MRSSKPVTYFETFAVSIPFYTPPQLALPTYRFRFTLLKHFPNFVFSIATARGSCWCSDIGETISNEQPNLLIQNHTSITLPKNSHSEQCIRNILQNLYPDVFYFHNDFFLKEIFVSTALIFNTALNNLDF